MNTIRMLAACAAMLFGASALAGEYEPMAVFAPLHAKAYRAEWTDEKGGRFVDTVVYEMILDGRALQSTHRIEGSTYGGQTIFFYDEARASYVFHYFTTGGFHTTGTATFEEGRMTSVEAVSGHPTIASVRAVSTLSPDEIRVDVVYVGKDGAETPSPGRVYRPVADPGALFGAGVGGPQP